MKPIKRINAFLILLFLIPCYSFSQDKPTEEKQQPKMVKPAPDRKAGEGEGPFERLIIRGAIVIDGTGAPPRGPVDIVIERNRTEDRKRVC